MSRSSLVPRARRLVPLVAMLVVASTAFLGVASANVECTNNGVIVARSVGRGCDECNNHGIIVALEGGTCFNRQHSPNVCIDDFCYLDMN